MFRKLEQGNFPATIKRCWGDDPKIQSYSRNSEHDLDNRVRLEVECLKNNSDLKFYEIYEDERFVGYFGVEESPFPCLSTMFIHPEYRERKEEVWTYVVSHLPDTFYAGLFKVNTRALNFYKKQGGEEVKELNVEGKPSVLLRFKR